MILFDQRGTGLSDRFPSADPPTVEQRLEDVRAVMDAADAQRAALCGVAEAGPLCALFARRYPERVGALILISSGASRRADREYPWAPTRDEQERFLDDVRQQWGGPVGLAVQAPSVADDVAFRVWWAAYLRMGASPGTAVALARMNFEIDVRDVLAGLQTPTLILHRTGDAHFRVEGARYLAARISGAKLVELPGADHLPWVGDQEALLAEIEEFVTGIRHTKEPDCILATVLVATVLGSTTGHTGYEARWETSLRRYDVQARREIEWFRGRELPAEPGRFLVLFDGPLRAVRCACALSELAGRTGIAIRAGLHVGECVVADDHARGVTVVIAEQVADRARPGEVLVSSRLRDFLTASDIRLGHWGSRVLDPALGGRLFTVERVAP